MFLNSEVLSEPAVYRALWAAVLGVDHTLKDHTLS